MAVIKQCPKCGTNRGSSAYTAVPQIWFGDGFFPVCNDCVADLLETEDYNLTVGNLLCQCANLPFRPEDWVNFSRAHKRRTFPMYAGAFRALSHDTPTWAKLNSEYLRLEKENSLEETMVIFQESKLKGLREKWGQNYLPEDLSYLERLYQGIMNTQNVSGTLQLDQALKLCKLSLLIDKRIRAEEDFDKVLKSYDSLAKLADFTPKNLKNTDEFESSGELWGYVEKTGWLNPFYRGEASDIVDLTMKEVQIHNRNLFINETGIDEEVKDRIAALRVADELEAEDTFFDADEEELDNLDAQAYLLEDFDEDAGIGDV